MIAVAAHPGVFEPTRADWPRHRRVRALTTTRQGGASDGPYASFNLALHVGDAAAAVASNRGQLERLLPRAPCWLEQVHGVAVADADSAQGVPRADAAVARRAGTVLAILTADCLPILLAADDAAVIGAAHGGWRGLAGGVIEATLAQMAVPASSVSAWLGPAIAHYEVGEEVKHAFVANDPDAAQAFHGNDHGKYWCDLYALARRRLAAAGVSRVAGGGECTFSDTSRYYSFRRDGRTGRMASLIWLDVQGHEQRTPADG